MSENIQSFDELKRWIYLTILPGVLLATIATVILDIVQQEYAFEFYANIIFVCVFMIGWLLVYRKRPLKVFEYLVLFLLCIYLLVTVTIEVFDSVDAYGEQTLGTFIIWTPLIIMYIFVVLEKRKALILSILLLVFSMIPSFLLYKELDIYFVDSLIQLYMLMAIYIMITFFVHRLFHVYAELSVMKKQLYLDPLTQVGNRLQIDKWLEAFVNAAKIDGSFSLIFFDVDHFKEVNDCYGHKVGDDVLKNLTQIVQAELGKEQLIGRWGGEEFLILVQSLECEAYNIANRLKQAIEAHNFGEVGKITASFGVTGYIKGDTVESILIRVDERLYVSKKTGRNRVTGKMITMYDE